MNARRPVNGSCHNRVVTSMRRRRKTCHACQATAAKIMRTSAPTAGPALAATVVTVSVSMRSTPEPHPGGEHVLYILFTIIGKRTMYAPVFLSAASQPAEFEKANWPAEDSRSKAA